MVNDSLLAPSLLMPEIATPQPDRLRPARGIGKQNADMINMGNLFTGGLFNAEVRMDIKNAADPLTRQEQEETKLPMIEIAANVSRFKKGGKKARLPTEITARMRTPPDINQDKIGGVTSRTNHLGLPSQPRRVRVKHSSSYAIVRGNASVESKHKASERAVWYLADELRRRVDISAEGLHWLLDRFTAESEGSSAG